MQDKFLLNFASLLLIALFGSCGTFVPLPPDQISNVSELEAYIQEVVDIGIPPGFVLSCS